MHDFLLELNDVSFVYSDGTSVFEGASLSVQKNELLVLRGDSGAGKSTFLKLCNRFCSPTSGTVTFHGNSFDTYEVEKLRSSIIYLPQLPLLVEGTVKDNLSIPFSFHSNQGKIFDAAKAGKWIDYFQVNVLLEQDALKLSVGQKQRLALIRAILLEPEILLLDEPGSALDSRNKALIENRIEHLIEESGISIIMATHSDVSFSNTRYRTLEIQDKQLKETGKA